MHRLLTTFLAASLTFRRRSFRLVHVLRSLFTRVQLWCGVVQLYLILRFSPFLILLLQKPEAVKIVKKLKPESIKAEMVREKKELGQLLLRSYVFTLSLHFDLFGA